MPDNRTAAEIERDIERERAGLAETITDLQDKFSVEAFARQMTDHFKEHGSDITRSVSNSVKENPMALALTGVGLAWMIFGNGSSKAGHAEEHSAPRSGLGGLDASVDRFHPRTADARAFSHPRDWPSWARDDLDTSSSAGAKANSEGLADKAGRKAGEAADAVSSATATAADGLHSAGKKTASAAKAAGDSVAGAAKSAADSVAAGASEATDRMAKLQARLAEGTETLSEEAKARVIAARRRALEARDAAARYGRKGRDTAVDLFEDQPLVAGAIALAVGAALGAALPRTRMEDKHLGAHSDQLFDEAERIYHEEKEKLAAVARTAADEARKVAREHKPATETLAETIVSEAKTSGKRIADAAKREAEKQDLGKDLGKVKS